MKRAIVLAATGVNKDVALAELPGKGTSTAVEADSLAEGPTPWLWAYRERYCAQWSARLNCEPLGVKPILIGVSSNNTNVRTWDLRWRLDTLRTMSIAFLGSLS